VINGIKPDLFLDGLIQHRRVVGGVDGTETGSERADALIAIDLDLQELHFERIACFCAVDVKRSGQRIVPGSHA
jgi:hypothetical protein